MCSCRIFLFWIFKFSANSCMHTSKILWHICFQYGVSLSINIILKYSLVAVFIGLYQLLVRQTEKLSLTLKSYIMLSLNNWFQYFCNSVRLFYILEMKARAVACCFKIMCILLDTYSSSIVFASLIWKHAGVSWIVIEFKLICGIALKICYQSISKRYAKSFPVKALSFLIGERVKKPKNPFPIFLLYSLLEVLPN